MRRARVALVALLLLAGCGDRDVAVEQLPPHARDELAAVFDPMVEPLGYRVTRAALITRETYVVDPDGDHLAIYLAPLTDITPDRFASDLPSIAATFLPYVFEQWPGLASFDVCQEPFEWDDTTPPSQTIVDVTREGSAAVDWGRLDLPALVAAGREVDGLSVWARNAVRDSSTWQDAVDG